MIGRRKQKFNLWSLNVQTPKPDLDEQVDVLLRKLKRFKNLGKRVGKFDARLSVVLEVVGEDTRPSVTMTERQLEALARMKISFGVSYYFFDKPFRK